MVANIGSFAVVWSIYGRCAPTGLLAIRQLVVVFPSFAKV
jgi:hypothetical protein